MTFFIAEFRRRTAKGEFDICLTSFVGGSSAHVARARVVRFVGLFDGHLVRRAEPAAEVDELAALATERKRPQRLSRGGLSDGAFANRAGHGGIVRTTTYTRLVIRLSPAANGAHIP